MGARTATACAAATARARAPGSGEHRLSRYITRVTSSGGPAVLVDEASEAILAHQLAASNRPRLGGRAGQLLLKPLMRSSAMVVLEERRQYPLQMSSAQDQEVIQALPPCCADEPLGDAVWSQLSTTAHRNDRGRFRVVHPFHPLAGREFQLLGYSLC